MENSGWCWYQDPRAVIHNNNVVLGGVEGNNKGSAVIGVYSLGKQAIAGRIEVHPNFDRDDHNSPVFHPLADGKLLTVYARHGKERFHYYRISESDNSLSWGKELILHHPFKSRGDEATYMNLFDMKSEGKIYNFSAESI